MAVFVSRNESSDRLLANDTDFGVRSEEVYLKTYADGGDARAGIGEYLSFYNTQRTHQDLGLSNPWGGIHYRSGRNVVTSPLGSTSTQESIRAVQE